MYDRRRKELPWFSLERNGCLQILFAHHELSLIYALTRLHTHMVQVRTPKCKHCGSAKKTLFGEWVWWGTQIWVDAGGGMGWCVIIDSCLWSCAMIRVLCGNYYSWETTTLSKIHAISKILGLAGVVRLVW